MLKAVLHRRYHSALFRCSQNSYLSAKDFENSHSVLSASSVGAAIGSAADTKSRTFADNVSQVQIKLGINLSRYGVNLSKLAVEDKLDQVIGREEEINKAIKILSRRRKNNPCLIGDAGVGKSAVAEGLARMIAAGDVPESMKDKVM